MAEKSKKPTPNKPKFSAWWIYTAIILVFLALNFFSSSSDFGNPKEILENQLITYAKDGDVKRIDISKSKQVAYIYLTEEASQKEKHSKPQDNGMSLLSSSGGADYEFRYGTLENFENTLNDIQENQGIEIPRKYLKADNTFFGDMLLTLLPIAVIIGIWIFIMRRMSSGGAGGAGGQIFNIGNLKPSFLTKRLM